MLGVWSQRSVGGLETYRKLFMERCVNYRVGVAWQGGETMCPFNISCAV